MVYRKKNGAPHEGVRARKREPLSTGVVVPSSIRQSAIIEAIAQPTSGSEILADLNVSFETDV